MLRPCHGALLSFLTLPVCAQTVWNVPLYTDVGIVLAQAAPGDVIQLAAQHPGFLLDKGVLVLGAPAIGTTIINFVPGGLQLPGPGSITVAVPAGQRAGIQNVSIAGMSTGNGFSPGSLLLQSGHSEIRNVSVDGRITISDGSHVLQRVGHLASASMPTYLEMNGGTCSITNSTLFGRSENNLTTWLYQPAITQTGGQLLASRLTARGGMIGDQFVPTVPTVVVQGGNARITDSTIFGGSRPSPLPGPGTAALVGNGNVETARTILIGGTGTTLPPPSTGFVSNAAMVGLYCPINPTLGNPFTATVTAGNSQDWLAVVGGFDGSPNSVPNFVEPVFGDLAGLVVLGVTVPGPGASLTLTVNVPNVPSLAGVAVFLQAVQQSGPVVRASALVGGTIH